MSVSSVSSSDPYAAQRYSGEEDKTGEQTSSQQPENMSQSSGGNGDEVHASTDDHQDDVSQSTASSDPANTSPSSSSGSGDSQAPRDDNSHREDVSKAAPSSDLTNTSPSSSGGSGDSRAPADDNYHRNDVSKATESSTSSGTLQPLKDVNDRDTHASANDSRQQIEVPEKTGRVPSENTPPTRSDIGGHDQANEYSRIPGSENRPPESNQPLFPGAAGDHGSHEPNSDEHDENRTTREFLLPQPGTIGGHNQPLGNPDVQQVNRLGQEPYGSQVHEFRPVVGAGNDKQYPVPSSTRPKRDDTDIPPAWSEEYADYVQRLGEQSPLDQSQLNEARRGLINAVTASHSRLADPATVDAIGNTVLDAINQSPTFRALISYSLNHGGDQLGDVMYTNSYLFNPDVRGERRPIPDMTLSYLQQFSANNMPIGADSSSIPRYDGEGPVVNVGAAPNRDSPYFAAWQQELVHELVHELTHSDDPPRDLRRSQMGPTEILTSRVLHDLGMNPPSFPGYTSRARDAYFDAADRAALLEAVQRNSGQERNFFQRLETIRETADRAGNIVVDGSRDASPDFHELEAPLPGAVGNNHTYVQPPPQPYQNNHTYALDPQGDLGHMHFNNGTVTLFPFADSAPEGAPTGYQSAYAASGASWDTQGRFFQYGKPVDGNPHMREFDFGDGSKVIASAHVPELTTSDLSKFEQVMTVTGASAGGAVVGFVTGGPVGAMVGGAAGAGGGAAIANTYPYDRIWQGYTFDYYNKGETKPFYTQYMYAWDTDWNRVGLLAKQHDASLWPDYADGNPDANWAWWKWKTGDAPVRT
ncbi:M85 family metallopeptidase [Paraburkholderia sp. J63]|uniref:M85 family metallopeptidase n=1 Tax=Paraburkholderia sp. J63 TaxID=2805434 RepID=UPI002ABE188C|nr:M85 family metallopeptidase [Paraburkholderia sp. J63]